MFAFGSNLRRYTKGNNGLVVGPKGSNIRRVQQESGARQGLTLVHA
jgi:hypothetical protein